MIQTVMEGDDVYKDLKSKQLNDITKANDITKIKKDRLISLYCTFRTAPGLSRKKGNKEKNCLQLSNLRYVYIYLK
jgi:hypothetical protein